jgi:hypothetical protein
LERFKATLLGNKNDIQQELEDTIKMREELEKEVKVLTERKQQMKRDLGHRKAVTSDRGTIYKLPFKTKRIKIHCSWI